MSRFDADYAGIGEMLNSSEMVAEMHRRAEAGRVYAEGIAPYDRDSQDGTHYKDSFKVSSGIGGGRNHDRAYGRLENTDDAALWVEIGSRNNPAHHVLGKSLDVMEE